ncbi:hypothetical protein SDC9_135286 [bioreactor metagenome]|uniref:Uncharacterized protein n=1 Tax=bioreactor metagenome TaxID=1076179 RepID=A0A645DG35_9ZZZZ
MENVAGEKTLIFRISELCQIINACRSNGRNPNQYYDELEILLECYEQSKAKEPSDEDADSKFLLASLR